MIDVQGRCPACRSTSLFLGDGGHVTCSRLDCPGPCAADELLHGESGAAALATIGRIRKLAAELFVEGATHTHRNIGRQLLNALQPPEDGGETTPSDGAAADDRATARVFAALHRSAEQDVTRVIDLYEQWVKAGPPPLGTLIARWWDKRLVELHHAIRPPEQPAHNAGPTVTECAADDAAHWADKYSGDRP